jgi:cytochrome c oxidase subunit 1/cytochrome c oxidase subunit I+III
MPRRIYTYADDMGWNTLNMITSVGTIIFAVGVLLLFWNVFVSRKRGRLAGDNPWDAPTLEWATTSPPPPYNFVVIPTVGSRHPLWESRLDEAQESHTEAGLALDKGKENIGTTPLDAEPDVILKMPGDSWSPVILSLGLTLIFIGLLMQWWWLITLSLLGSIVAILGWFWPESKLGETRAGAHV